MRLSNYVVMSHDLCCHDENYHHGNHRHKDGHSSIRDTHPSPGASDGSKQTEKCAAEEESVQDGNGCIEDEDLSETSEEEYLCSEERECGQEGSEG